MYRRLSILTLFALIISAASANHYTYAEAPATLSFGSEGPDVPDLQYRLQTLGYFNSSFDTSFGMVTRTGVMRFQKAYGLPVDGIAGPQTWKTLKKVTLSKPELTKLARVIYGEARGEIYKGQVAVGAVVMNRLQSPLFPKTLTDVIMEPYAFTAVADGQYWLIPDQTAFQAAKDAVRGRDPTDSALFYYNPATATSDWIRSRKVITKIGNHLFTL